MARVNIRLDMSGINDLLNSRDGPVGRMVASRTARIRRLARNNVNTDTGAMAAGIRSFVEIVPFRHVKGVVESTDPASMWVENGTGERARSGGGGLLRPRTASVFKFPDRGGRRADPSHRRDPSGFVYTPYSRGQPSQEFMWRALRDGTRTTAVTWRVRRET